MDFMLGARLKGLPGPILVTGHTGFKGTWLTFLLECLQVPVIGFALPPEKDSLFDRAKRTGSIPEEFADIRDLEAVSKFITKYKPSAIIHMAAQPLVLESYKTPRDTFETNVMGTVNVLDTAFKTSSVEAIIVITTDKVYRNDNSGNSFAETDPLAGKDPYSASKVGTEAVVAAWQQISKVSGGPKLISVRAGNVIGGGDWAKSRLLPDLIRGFISGEQISIRNPKSTRPWQHVLDPLHGYLLALDAILNGEQIDSFNFGPNEDSLTVLQVIETANTAWGEIVNLHIEIPENDKLTQIEALELGLDSSRANTLLNWKPHWSQYDAVIATTTWWKKTFIGQCDVEQACLEDIAQILPNYAENSDT
jgi:CDP-glucose 4,6-dehydratase